MAVITVGHHLRQNSTELVAAGRYCRMVFVYCFETVLREAQGCECAIGHATFAPSYCDSVSL